MGRDTKTRLQTSLFLYKLATLPKQKKKKMAAASIAQKVWTESDPSNKAAMCSSLRNSQELGLQLRFAAEKGRVLEVRKLLTAGAPVLRDAVSKNTIFTLYSTYVASEL